MDRYSQFLITKVIVSSNAHQLDNLVAPPLAKMVAAQLPT